MRKQRASDRGRHIIDWLLVGLALVVLAGLGVVVYRHLCVAGAGTHETVQSSRQQLATADSYAGWKTYSSTLGDFSLRYPASWDLSGFRGEEPLDASEMNGYESLIRLQSKLGRVDDFGININVSTDTSSRQYPTYGSGTTTQLANGITLWQGKEQEVWATGPITNNCPELQIGTDDKYSRLLPSGDYLSVYGSFCWGQNETTAKTYAQQVASSEWATAIAIVKSIQIN